VYGLQALGYHPAQIADMVRFMCGTPDLAKAPHVYTEALRARGFSDAQLVAIEDALETATDIHAAFYPFVIGERFCREQLGIRDAQLYDAEFTVLAHMGFTPQQIAEANQYLCGYAHAMGAPHLRAEDEAVFATQVSAEAQIDLLAVAQRFLTGGIAHTMQLPQQTTLEQCQHLIQRAWKKGLKSISLKRDHCALYEELALVHDVGERRQESSAMVFREAQTMMSGTVSQVAAQLLNQFMKTRRELPLRRNGFTQKTTIAGQAVYLRTGEYEDGTLGEVMIDASESPAGYRAMLHHFSKAISTALQYGVPLAAFVEAFARAQQGMPHADPHAAEADVSVLLEQVFRELASSYLVDTLDVRPARQVSAPRLVS
jgi:ribonucleoside-diphosphate reductase alpha chain